MTDQPTPTKRATAVCVRVTPAEHAAIEQKAAQTGATLSDYLRHLLTADGAL